jgi:hypothetical protein
MAIRTLNILPGVYYKENVQNITYTSSEEYPCFYGVTNHEPNTIEQRGINKYYDYDELCKTIDNGGICKFDDEDKELKINPLLRILKDYFTELDLNDSESICPPYIYVADMGVGNDLSRWKEYFEKSRVYKDITFEVYYGMNNIQEGGLQAGIDAAMEYIKTKAKALDLRRGFTTTKIIEPEDNSNKVSVNDNKSNNNKSNNSNDKNNNSNKNNNVNNKLNNNVFTLDNEDTELINLAYKNSEYNRIRVIEPELFGKHIARFCSTPVGEEVGFYQFNTVSPGTFKDRTPTQMLELQNGGVIFGRDEYSASKFYPKINLGVATNFAQGLNNRPADSLDSARRIADWMLQQVFDLCYPQIKARETFSNLAHLQNKINTLIQEAINNGYVVKYDEDTNPEGTYLEVIESDNNPYAMIVQGQIQPMNCTIAINVDATITQPAIKAAEEL